MKKIALIVLMMGLLLPITAFGQNYRLSDEVMDEIHAEGLSVFMDFNMFFPIVDGDVTLGDLNIWGDNNTIQDAFNNFIAPTQNIGEGNTGTNVQNGVYLSGDAQNNLSAFLNINAANSVIPIGINITVVQGDLNGTLNQTNSSFGMLNSSFFTFGGL